MIGFIIRHRSRASARLSAPLKASSRSTSSRTEALPHSPRTPSEEGDLRRACLGLGTVWATTSGECTVNAISSRPTSGEPARYEVTYTATGLRGEVPETELTPLREVAAKDPLGLLAGLQAEGYPVFPARETLVDALARFMHRVAACAPAFEPHRSPAAPGIRRRGRAARPAPALLARGRGRPRKDDRGRHRHPRPPEH